MKVLKNVNLHLKYVTRCFRNQMEKKSRTSAQFKKKKNDGHSSRHTQNEQLGKWLINYYCLAAKVKKNNGRYTVLIIAFFHSI